MIFNFAPILPILERLWPLPHGRFLKSCLFFNLRCFSERFFAHNSCNVLAESFFAMFLALLIFDPYCPFCKGYRPCLVADFADF